MAGALEQPNFLPGFADPVMDAQRVFRAAMDALARPGNVVALRTRISAPAPLSSEIAALLLALADHETPIWLGAGDAVSPDVGHFLTFHTGARVTLDPSQATFAVATSVAAMPPLAQLRSGTPDYPDRSATLLVAVAGFSSRGLQLEGPGIDGRISFGFAAMPRNFADELAANRSQFPCGVDVLLAAPSALVALPRSTRVVGGG
jgi:alpha-D-ribose 1-methylphosphonate 5-triphosphate synthase subunit PhnH